MPGCAGHNGAQKSATVQREIGRRSPKQELTKQSPLDTCQYLGHGNGSGNGTTSKRPHLSRLGVFVPSWFDFPLEHAITANPYREGAGTQQGPYYLTGIRLEGVTATIVRRARISGMHRRMNADNEQGKEKTMEPQMDMTEGFNSGGEYTPASQQTDFDHPAGRAPTGPVRPQGDPVYSRPQQAQRRKSPLQTQHDPIAFRQAVQDALARHQEYHAQLQAQHAAMNDPYADPYFGAQYDPRKELLHPPSLRHGDRSQSWPDAYHHPPMFMDSEDYGEPLNTLPALVDSMVRHELAERERFANQVNSFFDELPSLGNARAQISRLFKGGMSEEDFIHLLNVAVFAGEPRQEAPSSGDPRQGHYETFVSTTATAPSSEPIVEDEDRMIRAAVEQLFET